MACTAAHALFTNVRLQDLPQARAPTTSLLLLLTMLVRDSANYKVRGTRFKAQSILLGWIRPVMGL